jgi:hypothetical protein
MPYHKEKRGRGWVVVSDDTGKAHSNHPLPEHVADAQLKALWASYDKEKKKKVK